MPRSLSPSTPALFVRWLQSERPRLAQCSCQGRTETTPVVINFSLIAFLDEGVSKNTAIPQKVLTIVDTSIAPDSFSITTAGLEDIEVAAICTNPERLGCSSPHRAGLVGYQVTHLPLERNWGNQSTPVCVDGARLALPRRDLRSDLSSGPGITRRPVPRLNSVIV